MRTLILGFGLALGLAAVAAAPATAGGARDRVHADSFGNLVIYSPAGYKRIIVGQGEAASGYNQTGSYYESATPRVVAHRDRRSEAVRCWRPPHVWQGRSYMYGLPDGVVPQAPLVCE